MSAADYHLIVVDLRAAAQYDAAFIIRCFLNPLDSIDGDQCATMNADEALLEFFGQGFKGIIDEFGAVLVLDANVFLVGTKTANVGDRNQSLVRRGCARKSAGAAHSAFASIAASCSTLLVSLAACSSAAVMRARRTGLST